MTMTYARPHALPGSCFMPFLVGFASNFHLSRLANSWTRRKSGRRIEGIRRERESGGRRADEKNAKRRERKAYIGEMGPDQHRGVKNRNRISLPWG